MKNQLAVVEADAVIVSMRRASTALAEAKTIQQTKKIADVAAAAEIYAKRQALGEEAENMAAAIKVEALRKLGEMLKSAPKAKGVRMAGGGSGAGGTVLAPPASDPPTLSELGLSKKESAVAQKLAALPEKEFQQVRDGHVTVAKAIAAVDTAKAAKPRPAAPKPSAADDAYGDFDAVAELERVQKELEQAQAVIKAAEANDLKAEAMKWRRAYDAAQRTASEKMENAARLQAELQKASDRLTRIGKLFGERDPSKVAALVEAFYRQHAKVAA